MFVLNRIARINTYARYQVGMVVSASTQQKSCRHFHINPKLCLKMFMEQENNYAYSIMKNNGYAINLTNTIEVSKSLDKQKFDELLKENWTKVPPAVLFEIFPKLAIYCAANNLCISNTIFDNYIDNLTDNIRHASDKELSDLFYSLGMWPEVESIRTRNYIEVWAALDDECFKRLNKWSFDEMLSFIALFYMINVCRVSDFSRKCLLKLALKAKQLTASQLVQTMFFVGVMRKSPHDVHNLELCLERHFLNLSIDELAVIAMGLFKSKTPIRNPELTSNIIQRVIKESKTINEVSLAALLKVIRFSVKITTDNSIYEMLDVLQHEIPRLSTMCNVHVALVGTSTLTLHEDCIQKIAKKTIDLIPDIRLKDLERLVLTYGTFNFVPKTKTDFFQTVMDELRKPERSQEIDKYGRSFACCIAYFGLLGIYPVDLINRALSQEFLEITYGKQCFNYGREILTLNNYAEMFCTQDKMNVLSERAVSVLAKKYTDFVPSETYSKSYNITEKMMLSVMKLLRMDRGGEEFVIGHHILSHHQRGDIIVCDDHDGKPVPVSKAFNIYKVGPLLRPPDDKTWITLIIAGRNSIIKNTNTVTGPFNLKKRELKKLGYYPAMVSWNVYNNLEKDEEKLDYLKRQIAEAVKNK